MDIHKPKPVHTWREFASEIIVIVIGISIALGAEQVVEGFRQRHQVEQDKVIRWNERNRLAAEQSQLHLSKPLDAQKILGRLRERLVKEGILD